MKTVCKYADSLFKLRGKLIIAFLLCNLIITPSLSMTDVSASFRSSELPDLFEPRIYRIAEHMHTVDESSVSNHYFSKFVKGYDALYFAYQSNYLLGDDIHDPDFESYVPLSNWGVHKNGSFYDNYNPEVERSGIKKMSGNYSLHLKLDSSQSRDERSYVGVSQEPTHPTPLSANLNVTYGIFPALLTDTTNKTDSMIEVRYSLLYWDSKKFSPNIVFIYQDEGTTDSFSSTPYKNDTNNVYLLRTATHNTWNRVTENLTDIAWSYWGEDFTYDQAIRTVQLGVHAENSAVAEVYFDSLSREVSKSNAHVYATQIDQLEKWSTPSLKLFTGEELNGVSNLFALNIPKNNFIESTHGSTGPLNDIHNVHNSGHYVGLAHPFQNKSQLQWALNSSYDVDMIDIYGNTGCRYVTDTTIWDNYLNKEIFAVSTATPNVHNPIGIDRMNTDGYAIYVFSNSSESGDLLENMVMGRSFIESVSLHDNYIGNDRTVEWNSANGSVIQSNISPMLLYFTAQKDQVPMGRYPIILDTATKRADLHIIVKNIPSLFSNITLNIIRNGDSVIKDTFDIQDGTSKFDKEFSLDLSNKNVTYFRYEILDSVSGKPLAFSQPIIFVKNQMPLHPLFWTALVPKNTAALQLSSPSISFDNNNMTLTQHIKMRIPQGEAQLATLKTYIPTGMFKEDNFAIYADPNEIQYFFDSKSRIMTLNTPVNTGKPVTITLTGPTKHISSLSSFEANSLVTSTPDNKDQLKETKDLDNTPVIYQESKTFNPADTAKISPNKLNELLLDSVSAFEYTDHDIYNSKPRVIKYSYFPHFNLNGSDFKDIAHHDSQKLANFSLAGWFKANNSSQIPLGCNAFIINKGGIGSDELGQNLNYGIWMTRSKKIQGGFESQQGGTEYFVISQKKYDDNKWHYGILTYNGSTINLYIDGFNVANKTTFESIPDTTGNQTIRIGANSFRPDGFFPGSLDELRIWNRALTEQEVNEIYATAKFDTRGQVLYLPFD